MKNIIILGEPRCGKSTLANMIVDTFHYQLIRIDALRDTFKKIYPELNIAPNIATNNEKFQLFLQEYLRNCSAEEERNKYGYVMEGCETSVYDCNRLFNNDDNLIYYLVPSDISPTDFFNNIRKHDTPRDWTYNISDEELLKYTTSMTLKGKKIKEDCEKYNIPCFDTSYNREEVLQTILNDIKENLRG